MIYFNEIFSNYAEFCEKFGVTEHGNGVKSRRNKILLANLKNRELLHKVASARECWSQSGRYTDDAEHYFVRWRCHYEDTRLRKLLFSSSLDELRLSVANLISQYGDGNGHLLAGKFYIRSTKYEIDDMGGICEDGDSRSVRYRNLENGRIFKMRAGKFMRSIIEGVPSLDAILSEQVKIWYCEEFAEAWKAYAATQIGDDYELVVDDDFSAIYSSYNLEGNFQSCMTNNGYWSFYRDSVTARAASLRKDGRIHARCVIYDDVRTNDGKVLRLAERQYATDGNETLKRMLVLKLIDAGEIDGYKKVGADCSDARAFVNNNGDPIEGTLWIPCNLDFGDTVSYQDSFKWYDMDSRSAYNRCCQGDDYDLAVTCGELEGGGNWSNYNAEYIDEDDAVWVEHRDDYFYDNQTVYAENTDQSEFEEDCIYIHGDYYYAGRNAAHPADWGIYRCDRCDEYYVEGSAYHSGLTDEYYCCEGCKEQAELEYKDENWYYAEFNDKYYEDDDDVMQVFVWSVCLYKYYKTTVGRDYFDEMVEDGEATVIDGVAYIDTILHDGEPAHYSAAAVAVSAA